MKNLTLPHEFIFVFILHFIEVTLPENLGLERGGGGGGVVKK